MNIVCLIRPNPPLFYFVNTINSSYPVALVIIEQPKDNSRNIFSKIRQHGFQDSYRILRRKLSQQKNRTTDYDVLFGNKWYGLDKEIPFLEVDDINSDIVSSKVKEIKPDLILDHGTSVVKNHILGLAELALNLHWGLSPYYRGTNCTEWALVNWDPYNIGVTIHKLTKDIDGGDILVQKRATIKAGDTPHSINMQLTVLGTALILDAVEKLKNGNHLDFAKQDFSLGHITYLRQWNHLLDKQIEYIKNNNLIELMLEKPSRDHKLPVKDVN